MFDIYRFLTYLNTQGKETTYSTIIIFLLTNTEMISQLTISEIAEKCYVSPATLTRFCHHFGFESFSELRKALEILYKSAPYIGLRMKEKEFQLLQKEPDKYLANYAQEIITAVQDVLTNINVKEIDQLLKAIHEASDVVLIGYSATLELAKEVQGAFLSCKKILYTGETDLLQEALVNSLDKNALILIISSYGTLLTKNPEFISKISLSPAKSIFITQNTKNTLTNQFSHTIHVTKENYVQIGTYPLTFFFDYFTRRYASLYSQK